MTHNITMFNNDTATHEQRVAYLEGLGYHIEEEGCDDSDYEATLVYPNGNAVVLDALDTSDAYFEACNIVKQ